MFLAIGVLTLFGLHVAEPDALESLRKGFAVKDTTESEFEVVAAPSAENHGDRLDVGIIILATDNRVLIDHSDPTQRRALGLLAPTLMLHDTLFQFRLDGRAPLERPLGDGQALRETAMLAQWSPLLVPAVIAAAEHSGEVFSTEVGQSDETRVRSSSGSDVFVVRTSDGALLRWENRPSAKVTAIRTYSDHVPSDAITGLWPSRMKWSVTNVLGGTPSTFEAGVELAPLRRSVQHAQSVFDPATYQPQLKLAQAGRLPETAASSPSPSPTAFPPDVAGGAPVYRERSAVSWLVIGSASCLIAAIVWAARKRFFSS